MWIRLLPRLGSATEAVVAGAADEGSQTSIQREAHRLSAGARGQENEWDNEAGPRGAALEQDRKHPWPLAIKTSTTSYIQLHRL